MRLDADIFSNLNGTNGLTITGFPSGVMLSLATGDFNGDGFDDLAVGTSQVDKSVYLIFGPLNVTAAGSVPLDSLMDGIKGFKVMSSNPQEKLGASVAFADVNGDSKQDLIITTPDSSDFSPRGYLAVIFGASGPYPPSLNVNTMSSSVGFIIRCFESEW